MPGDPLRCPWTIQKGPPISGYCATGTVRLRSTPHKLEKDNGRPCCCQGPEWSWPSHLSKGLAARPNLLISMSHWGQLPFTERQQSLDTAARLQNNIDAVLQHGQNNWARSVSSGHLWRKLTPTVKVPNAGRREWKAHQLRSELLSPNSV